MYVFKPLSTNLLNYNHIPIQLRMLIPIQLRMLKQSEVRNQMSNTIMIMFCTLEILYTTRYTEK